MTSFSGGVEIPSRLVLAPMAGVSVQAFRRQGRRYGAGLVCSEMVSVAGIQHRNERTLGYLRVAADEHPLAIQIFGSDPAANATSLPVSVKMRRGLENGSRTCLTVGPRLVEAGASSLTLHPRSAKQMYTGEADHSLTAELVELVDVPVVASGDITSRAKAQSVLATTGAAAVMVGRGAQGNPRALRAPVQAGARPARDDRRGRAAPARRGARSRRAPGAPRGRAAADGRDPARHADLDLRRRLARGC